MTSRLDKFVLGCVCCVNRYSKPQEVRAGLNVRLLDLSRGALRPLNVALPVPRLLPAHRCLLPLQSLYVGCVDLIPSGNILVHAVGEAGRLAAR